MEKIKSIKWSLIFDKVGTVVWDRRFWQIFLFPTLFSLGLFPQLAEANTEYLTDQAIGWSRIIMESVVPVLSAYLLGNSWTKRPPSGLGFKELISELGSTLRDLGIE